MRALRIIVAIEAAALALAVGLVLSGERHTSFPSSVTVTTPAPAPDPAPVPVSVDLGLTGATTTTAVVASRGGRAVGLAVRRLPG
jgi:hypothetical protein